MTDKQWFNSLPNTNSKRVLTLRDCRYDFLMMGLLKEEIISLFKNWGATKEELEDVFEKEDLKLVP